MSASGGVYYLLLSALLQLLNLVFGKGLPLDELQRLQLGLLDGADPLAQLVQLALRLLHDALQGLAQVEGRQGLRLRAPPAH